MGLGILNPFKKDSPLNPGNVVSAATGGLVGGQGGSDALWGTSINQNTPAGNALSNFLSPIPGLNEATHLLGMNNGKPVMSNATQAEIVAAVAGGNWVFAPGVTAADPAIAGAGAGANAGAASGAADGSGTFAGVGGGGVDSSLAGGGAGGAAGAGGGGGLGGYAPYIYGGATLLGSYLSSNAAQNAANTQSNAATTASNNSMSMFNTINQQNQPFIQAGTNAIKQMGDMTAPGGSMSTPFTNADLNSNLAPNYQFQLQQGLGANKNAANLQTGLVSGNAMMAGDQYAQNFAGNAYQNAFNNYNTSNNTIFNRLSSIAGTGQVSNQTTANAGTSATASANNYLTGGAAATAAGTVGSANAYSQGLGSAANGYMLNQILNSGA